MKNVLIISYYYYPLNSTASDRPHFWLKNLHQYGINAYLLCKNWGEISDLKSNVYQVEMNSKAPMRKNGGVLNKLYKQIQEPIEASNFALGETELLLKARNLVSELNISTVITTSSPFSLLKLGYLLKTQIPSIKWIADFRDDWSTNKLLFSTSAILRKIQFYSKSFFEKKWLREADLMISVSEVYANRLSRFHNLEAVTIPNGYDYIKEAVSNINHGEMNFTYSGNVYSSQDFESCIESINKVAKNNTNITTKINFIGVNISEERQTAFKESGSNCEIVFHTRMDRKELDKFNLNVTDCFMLAAYGDLKGIPSSKLYYFISFRKPVYLFPSDKDIIEETLNESETRIDDLEKLYISKTQQRLITFAKKENVEKYSRKLTTRSLADAIKRVHAS